MNDIFEKIQADFDEFMKSAKEFIEKEKAKQIADTSKVRRWKPEDGDKYYAICWSGRIDFYLWNSDSKDDLCFKLGNCFKTEEEAQKELDRRLAEQELLDMVDAKMSDENYKWFIEYDPRGPVFYPNNTVFRFATPLLFSSKESAQKAIDTLGTEKLKLIFRID